MQFEKIILELLSRIQKLEEEVDLLKQILQENDSHGFFDFPVHVKVMNTPIKVLSCNYSNSVTSLGSTYNSSSLIISTTSVVTSSTESLKPSKSSMRIGISFFQTTIKVDKDTYVVRHFEFVDKPKDNEVEIILNGEMQSLGNQATPASLDDIESSNIKQIANEKNKILNEGFKDFDDADFVNGGIESNI